MSHPLLTLAHAHGTPVIENDSATFLREGKKPPTLLGDFTDWEDGAPALMRKIAPRLWAYTLPLPADAYIEYAFLDGAEHLPDPFNPRLVSNGMGKYNHWFGMPAYAPTPLARRKPGIARGVVTRHRLATQGMALGQERTVWLYRPELPPGASAEPYPLLVVWDGREFLRQASLAALLDNLIAQRRIRPVALALLDHGRQARFVEYACSEATLCFLQEALLPLARRELNLLDTGSHPGAFGVMGASMGGVMSLFAGMRMPQIFGRVLSLSGAFTLYGRDAVVYDLARAGAADALKIWMNVGRFEWLLDTNRRMSDLLHGQSLPLQYRETNAGHNYTAWRDDLWRGLEFLFGL